MTGTLPSWSPLNNAQLATQIQTRLNSEKPYEREDAQRDLYFLERYAWQEYPAKCSRWRVDDDPWAITGGSLSSGPWTKKTWNTDMSWVLLLDPLSKQPIAAHIVDWWKLERKEDKHTYYPVNGSTTSVWFAGDPRVCGMFAVVGDGSRAAFGHRFGQGTLKSWKEGPSRFEKSAPLLAAQPYADTTSREFGPYLADQPEPPPRPKRFGALRGG